MQKSCTSCENAARKLLIKLMPGRLTKNSASASFSTDPKWTSQQFTFVGFLSDILEVEVKDKFARSRPIISRFLGKRKILLASLLHRATPW